MITYEIIKFKRFDLSFGFSYSPLIGVGFPNPYLGIFRGVIHLLFLRIIYTYETDKYIKMCNEWKKNMGELING